MSFYTDFIDTVADNIKIFQEYGHQFFQAPEYRVHAAEWSVFRTVTDFMKESVIIRLRGEQSAIFLDTPFDPQQDFIQWLRLPYEVIYIQPDTPFRFTGYAPKSEIELRTWAQNHRDALTDEERQRLEHLREQPEPNIHGVVLLDATKYLDTSKKNWLPHELHTARRYDMLQTIEGIDYTTVARLFHVIFLMPLQDYPMNIHSFTIGVLKDNTLWCAKRTSTETVLTKAQQWVIHLINFLSSPSVKLVRNAPDAALQKARARRGKAPLPGWYEIVMRFQINEYTRDKKSPQAWHHSFRYSVRGHFRRYEKGRMAGRICWVKAHERGLQNQLYRPKGYRVGAEERAIKRPEDTG